MNSIKICVDDFGDEVHKCHWTGAFVAMRDAAITGGMVPGVKVKYMAIKDYKNARQDAQKAFNEMDANCNTCKHLERVSHEKNKAGFLFGKCKINSKEPKLYAVLDDIMMFHPDDCMMMQCWERR